MYYTLELNFEPPRDFRASLLSTGFLGKDKKLKSLEAARFWVYFEPMSTFSVWETFKDMNRFVNECNSFVSGLGGGVVNVDMGQVLTEQTQPLRTLPEHPVVSFVRHKVTMASLSSSVFQQAMESWKAQNSDHLYLWTTRVDDDPLTWVFSGIQASSATVLASEGVTSHQVLALGRGF